jgi:Ca2+-dependent lipid-binding protein
LFSINLGDTADPLHDHAHKSSVSGLQNFEGIVLVDLIKARNLVKADIIGKSDPYAVLKFGKQKDQTSVVKNTLEPQWDHHTEFQYPDDDAGKVLIEVFDADKHGKDKTLGSVEVDLLDITNSEGRWFPLQGMYKIIF